jgi:hypothetical protein
VRVRKLMLRDFDRGRAEIQPIWRDRMALRASL